MENSTNQEQLLGLEDLEATESSGWVLGYAQNVGARQQQQDCLGTATGSFQGKPVLLAVLADGMGGMKNGAEFSRIAVSFHVNHLQRILDECSALPNALLKLAVQANDEAHKIFEEDRPGGTTLISALFAEDRFYTLSVGDSRICLFREIQAHRYVPLQLNREHLFGAALDERAWMGDISFDDAKNNMFRDSLNSAIGESKIRHIDRTLNSTRFLGRDRLVLMSDGIYRSYSETELARAMDSEPKEAADRIVEDICRKKIPHQDNMSILIIGRKQERKGTADV